MAIEFLLDLDCPVKERTTSDALMRTLRDRGRLQSALDTLDGKDEPEHANDEVRRVVKLVRVDGEGGERTERLDLDAFRRDVEQRFEHLSPLAHHCARCRARIGGDFGCYGSIGYPIEEESEALLIDRLPPVLGTIGGSFLQRALSELGFDGAPVRRMRAEGRTFFTRDRPLTQRWSDGKQSFEVTTDELVHLAFFGGNLRPNQSLLIALVFGVVPHAVAPEDLQAMLGDKAALEGLLEPVFIPRALEGTQIAGMLSFFEAVRRALLIGCTLRVDA